MKSFNAYLVRHVFPVVLCVVCGDSLAAEKPPKPDVLVIMPDQMRGDCLSILGHAALRTPHLDELARDGALFRRAYTTVASCIPARHALLTGLFPQTSGVVGYAARPLSSPTMPQLLSDAGYTTVLVGRNMHQVPRTNSYGYQTRILGSTHVDEDDYDTYLTKVARHTEGIRELVADWGLSYNGWEAKPWPLADEHHPTAWIVRQARSIVADSTAAKPLFLTASFYAPHPPLFPPKQYFEHAPCYSKAQAFHALTDGRFKYIWRPTDGMEHLFDLDSDPREEHDLAKDAAYQQTLETWRATLTERLAQRPEGFSDGDQLIPGRPYKPLHAPRP